MVDISEVSAAEMVASVVSNNGEQFSSMTVKPISFRFSIHVLARVDALASKGNKSRNAMLNMLLDVGLEEVLRHLPENTFEEIQSRESHAMQQFLDDGEIESLSE